VTESFRATATSIEGFERTVVVKRLLPELRHDPDLDDCLLTTLRPTVALSHANIAQVLDVSTRDGVGDGRYWVTQHVSGWSLAALLERARARGVELPLELAGYVALETTKALDYAHRLQPAALIIHGNLSATNLLISHEGEVKVTDFGVALSLRRRREAHAPPTPHDDLTQLLEILRQCLATDLPPRLLEPLQQLATSTGEGGNIDAAGDLHEQLLAGIVAERLRWSRSDLVQWLVRSLATDSFPVAAADSTRSVESIPVSVDVSLDSVPSPVVSSEPPTELLDDAAVLSDAPGAPETSSPPTSAEIPIVVEVPSSAKVPSSVDVPISVDQGEPALAAGPPISASLLVLTLGGSVGHSISAHVAALLQRGAHDIHWLPGGQLAVVLQQSDGRDTEQAVRLGLSLLRALGPVAKQSNIAVDLAHFEPGHLDRVSFRFDPEAVARQAVPLSAQTWYSPGRVVVSRRATRELRSLFRLKRAHDLGFAVVGSRSIEQASGPFFGREQELQWLAAQLDERGPRGALAVVGATGLGKTRLLLEFAKQLRERTEPLKVCVASCPGRGQISPYSAILALLARVSEIREGDTEPRSPKSGSVLADVAETDLARVQSLLAESVAATPSLDQELRDLLSRIVMARTRRAPHLIVLDGAHQADLISRILLHDIEQAFGERAMLVLLSRDDLVLQQLGLNADRQCLLPPLEATTMARLIEARLGVTEVPAELLEHFTRSAAGNPFVLEELLREALAQGQVTLGRNKVKSYDLAARIELPRSLRLLAEPQDG
jgi:serine/threonine protein kinase